MITVPAKKSSTRPSDIIKIDPSNESAILEDPWVAEVPGTRLIAPDPRTARGSYNYHFSCLVDPLFVRDNDIRSIIFEVHNAQPPARSRYGLSIYDGGRKIKARKANEYSAQRDKQRERLTGDDILPEYVSIIHLDDKYRTVPTVTIDRPAGYIYKYVTTDPGAVNPALNLSITEDRIDSSAIEALSIIASSGSQAFTDPLGFGNAPTGNVTPGNLISSFKNFSGKAAEVMAITNMRKSGLDPALNGGFEPPYRHRSEPPFGPQMKMFKNAGFFAKPLIAALRVPASSNKTSEKAPVSPFSSFLHDLSIKDAAKTIGKMGRHSPNINNVGKVNTLVPNISSGPSVKAAIGLAKFSPSSVHKSMADYRALTTDIKGPIGSGIGQTKEKDQDKLKYEEKSGPIQVVASLNSRLVPLEVRFTPAIQQIEGSDSFFIRLRFLTRFNCEIDIEPYVTEVQHGLQVREKMTCQYAPAISAKVAEDNSGRVKIRCTQVDPFAARLSVVRVPIFDPTNTLVIEEIFSGDLSVGQEISIVDEMSGYPKAFPHTYAYRAVSFNLFGEPSMLSTVTVDCKKKSNVPSSNAFIPQAVCKVTAFNTQRDAVQIVIDDIPDNATVVRLLRRKANGSEEVLIPVDPLTEPDSAKQGIRAGLNSREMTAQDEEERFRIACPEDFSLIKRGRRARNRVTFLDRNFKDKTTYVYTPVFYITDRRSFIKSTSTATVKASFSPTAEGFDFRYGTPKVEYKRGDIGNASVHFDCVAIIKQDKQGLESVIQTLDSLGVRDSFADTIREDRSKISDLVGVRVERIKHPEGDIVDFGLVEGTTFRDDAISRKLKNAPRLEAGSKYTYVLNLILKPISELFESVTTKQVKINAATGESIGKAIAINPLQSIERNTGQPSFLRDFLDGDVGVSSRTEAFIPHHKPTVQNVQARRGLLDTVTITWEVVGGPVKSVLLFEVYVWHNSVFHLAGTVTPLPRSQKTVYMYKDLVSGSKVGRVRYRVRPIYIDGEPGRFTSYIDLAEKKSDCGQGLVFELMRTAIRPSDSRGLESLGIKGSASSDKSSKAIEKNAYEKLLESDRKSKKLASSKKSNKKY